MEERPRERTWLCSVVFVDIVHYSAQSVTLELNWKARLNRYLAASIQDVPEPDRVILDTGDGAAICFLGDPEAAMFCALRLLDAFVREEVGPVGMRVRIGVNVGPVKLVRDLNGNVNAIGDGINVGQRVMSFAAENQILVSRSFHEVASRLSERYADLFRYVGVHRDKNVREHELYELLAPGAPPRPPPGETRAAPPAPRPTPPSIDPVTAERLERHLAQLVGPIARVLVRDASTRTVTPRDAVRALAEHVPGPPEAQARFVEEISAELALAGPGPAGAPASTPSPVPTATPAPPLATPRGVALAPDVLERAARELAAVVGPVARLLVARAAPAAASEAALYAALAPHVPEGPDREAFLAAARTG